MRVLKIIIPIIMISIILFGCKKFLDAKPDKSLYIPTSLADCQALLDDYNTMNTNYPYDGELASDHYYLTDVSWGALSTKEEKDNYIWDANARHVASAWSVPHKPIFNANLVLEVLQGIKTESAPEYRSVQGSALFFRGLALYSLASLFCNPYDEISSVNDLGMPIRLSSEVDKSYPRGTVKQTYDQIIADLKAAAVLLPETSIIKSRPNKVAAYAALARIYLSMRKYPEAGVYADLSLKANNKLLNYFALTPSAAIPFTRFNDEVIFSQVIGRPSALSQTNSKVLKSLYDSYLPEDIRREIFFRANTAASAGTFAFKGSYDGSNTTLFIGLATDEMYFIRAECNARAGKTNEALKDLNDLLKTRWQVNRVNGSIVSSKYVDYSAGNADEALGIILREREKELVFRGLRWTDLRRLNKEPRYAITLTRIVNGVTYSLPPNDLRYTLLIPENIITTTSIPQNPR